MKRMMFMKRMIAMMAVVFSVAMFASCSDDDEGGNGDGNGDTISVESVTLTPNTLNLKVGETATLDVTITPANATDTTVVWDTSDETIATVENGVVTAVAEGSATITVRANGGEDITATCSVTVAAVVLPVVGDFFYSDGTYGALDEGKTPVGVVFYAGDVTADDASLAEIFPNGTRGLALSLKSLTESVWTQYASQYASDVLGDWRTPVICSWAMDKYPDNGITDQDKMNGYSNTIINEAWNEDAPILITYGPNPDDPKGDPIQIEIPVTIEAIEALINYRSEVVLPEGVSPWYVPSYAEWEEIVKNVTVVNESLAEIGATQIMTVFDESYLRQHCYWTSTTLESLVDPWNPDIVSYNDIEYYYDFYSKSFTSGQGMRNNLMFVFAF